LKYFVLESLYSFKLLDFGGSLPWWTDRYPSPIVIVRVI